MNCWKGENAFEICYCNILTLISNWKIKDANFFIEKSDFNFINNFLDKGFSKKSIKVIKSKIFYKGDEGQIVSFFSLENILIFQNDLKKVIAYSTCSQLGFMMFACGLSHYSIALFHLANHALFKALLFLSAGCIIHGLLDEQDLRKMGGYIQILPVSYTMVLIGSLALVGFPFLTGFYSKDVVLEVALASPSFVGSFAHWLGCIAAFCTSFYSFRLMFLTFINNSNSNKVYVENDWSLGRMTAASKENGILKGAANPRFMQGYAIGRWIK